MAVYKRNNIWYIDYYINVGGKRKRRREPAGKRKDLVELRLKECRAMIKGGKDPNHEHPGPGASDEWELDPAGKVVPTLAQFVPVFLKLHGKEKSKNTQGSYQNSLKHLMPVFKKVRINALTKVKVKTYMANRANEGASGSTVNRETACLKCIISRALEWEYIDKNPLTGLKMLKEPPPVERYLTKDEAERLIAVSPPYLRDIIIFALGTGARKSEMFNLTWDDVVINEVFRYGEITVLGKGDKRRNIRMNKTVYNLIVRKMKDRDSQYVFPSMKTDKNITHVKRSFATALKKAGIDNFRFHDLRHTAASWMVQSGVDLYSVLKIFGHSSIRSTQRYAHLSPGYLENEISKIDHFLSPGNESKKVTSELVEKAVV